MKDIIATYDNLWYLMLINNYPLKIFSSALK